MCLHQTKDHTSITGRWLQVNVFSLALLSLELFFYCQSLSVVRDQDTCQTHLLLSALEQKNCAG